MLAEKWSLRTAKKSENRFNLNQLILKA